MRRACGLVLVLLCAGPWACEGPQSAQRGVVAGAAGGVAGRGGSGGQPSTGGSAGRAGGAAGEGGQTGGVGGGAAGGGGAGGTDAGAGPSDAAPADGAGSGGQGGMGVNGGSGGVAGGGSGGGGSGGAAGSGGRGGSAGMGGAAGGSGGAAGGGGSPAGSLTWHSHDVMLQMGMPQATIAAQGGGNVAQLRFYSAVDAATVDVGTPYATFIASAHPETFNKAERLWTSSADAAKPYPYAGRSTVPRGMDTPETAAPSPMGVLDLQLHPPSTDTMAVAAFVAPVAGTYVVSNLAARKVHAMGGSSKLDVYGPQKLLVASVRAMDNGAWVTDPSSYPLGSLPAGAVIYFAVDRDGVFYFDATEIAWTVTRTGP